jgi:hypothetical protein
MKKYSIVLCFCCLSFLLACGGNNSGNKFTSKAGQYEIEFPGEPKLSERKVLLDSLGGVDTELAAWENEQVACWVSVATYNDEQLAAYAKDTTAFLSSLQAAALQNLGMQLKSEQRDSLVLGLSFSAESIDRKANCRIRWQGQRLYQLGWVNKSSKPDSLWANREKRFFESFKAQ